MNSKLFTFFILILVHSDVFAQVVEKINKEAGKQTASMLELCYDLHRNPELSFQEFETAKKMAAELEKAGFEVTRNFGGNNVVGVLKNGDGPVVMLRTDMDALPVEEKTGFEFASTQTSKNTNGEEVPVMHACGHDIHMSVWAGTIHTLAALKKQWKGTLLVIAQQAEEFSGGAGLAIETGLFQKFPTPDYAMAYHINPELESGTIGLVGGPVFAGVKTVEITVHGKGGHGAYPEKCIDPIVIASRIVLDLQTIVSREISPLEPVVVTVGSIHGGTRPNIIPDEVKMELTLRYYSDEAIEKVIAAINRISKSAALTAGMPEDKLPLVEVSPADTPPVLNNPDLSRKIHSFASEIVTGKNIVEVSPAMVGEDFGKYGRTPKNIPICLIWLGSTSPELMQELETKGEKPAPLHSPLLHPDYEKTIETGIKVMTGNMIGLLSTK
ncbi:M20 metallopeptidase family protein [Maribellus maritimus]|uniref:M20 metallopeptidase family protein n=1 Tax=Maribellus maritimus TaxID=2870838 RepID=UPI001EE9F764|nr:amidohydrolase [Maribellus maritimus]MCG6188093.1 amidohydrolase [Maribellus maritimus]